MLKKLKSEFDKLNESQRKAVFSPIDRPILVVAGAGSGKTRVLTLRIAYLVREIGIPENRILAVTFTNKAANEMKDRLSSYVDVDKLTIGTFHSFALRLIKREAGNYIVYDEEDTKTIIESILKELNLNHLRPSEVRSAISRYKNTKRKPENIDEYIFAEILNVYQRRLDEARALDFDDILIKALEILRDEDIRKRYSQRFYYVLVDEYQDTNPLQHELLVRIVGDKKHRRIFVVGDEDQSIYSFRGADFRIFLNFKRDFPETEIVKLEKNYRSHQKILDLANMLIKNNINRRDKVLVSDVKDGPNPVYMSFSNADEEANWIAREIKKKGFPYDKVMILYRANYMSRAIEQAFIKHGLPYMIIGDIGFFQRAEIKDLISFLRVSVNIKDFVSLRRSLGLIEGIGEATINKVIRALSDDEVEMVEKLKDITSKQRRQLKMYLSLINGLRNYAPREALNEVIERINYFSYLERRYPDNHSERKENVMELLSMASKYRSIDDFLDTVSLLTSVDIQTKNGSISLMTIHAAKGLESDVVFVIGLEEENFPHYKAEDIEEERRLCYVAITRAKRYLYLSSVKSRSYRSNLDPSRFIYEMGLGKVGNYKKGDTVYHKKYGKGKILDIDSSTIKVMFREGVKIFLRDKAKLIKL